MHSPPCSSNNFWTQEAGLIVTRHSSPFSLTVIRFCASRYQGYRMTITETYLRCVKRHTPLAAELTPMAVQFLHNFALDSHMSFG
jgi:hypothetical protein